MTPREVVIRAIEQKESPLCALAGGCDRRCGRAASEAHYGRADYLYACAGSHMVREKNKNHVELGGGLHRDIFGVAWQKQPGAAGDIGDIVTYQLAEAEMGVPTARAGSGAARRKVRAYGAEHPDRFRIFELSTTLFERAWTLRGMEDLLADFLLAPFVIRLLGAITDYALEVIRIACRYDIDAIMFGDDYGQQQGLLDSAGPLAQIP